MNHKDRETGMPATDQRIDELAWDASFRNANDTSGRAMKNAHQQASHI